MKKMLLHKFNFPVYLFNSHSRKNLHISAVISSFRQFSRSYHASSSPKYWNALPKSLFPENYQDEAENNLPIGHPYRIGCCALIYRRPVIKKLPTAFELEYQKYREEMDWEKCGLTYEESLHIYGGGGALSMASEGVFSKKFQERKQKNMTEKEKAEAEKKRQKDVKFLRENIEKRKIESAFDPEFFPAPKITKDDQENNLQSLYRKLDQTLYLLVKKNRKEHCWQLPQRTFIQDEDKNLRDCVDKILARFRKTEFYVTSNAPATFY
eukprot:Sdes_comp16575_c0_seq1m5885